MDFLHVGNINEASGRTKIIVSKGDTASGWAARAKNHDKIAYALMLRHPSMIEAIESREKLWEGHPAVVELRNDINIAGGDSSWVNTDTRVLSNLQVEEVGGKFLLLIGDDDVAGWETVVQERDLERVPDLPRKRR